MTVQNYFETKDPAHWLAEIKKSDWSAGQFLYELLRDERFFAMVGEGSRVLLLTEGDTLLSFCTYAKLDDIQPTELSPWMGFVYTFPQYRGHRYVGELFRAVAALASEEHASAVHISTNHIGLYEKYSCEFYREMNDRDGEPSRVYRFFPDRMESVRVQTELTTQLSRDYCCAVSAVRDKENHFTVLETLPGQRRFRGMETCALKIASVNGKLLFCGKEEIIRHCEAQFKNEGAPWFFEIKNLRRIEELLAPFGQRIRTVHPFFLPRAGMPEHMTDAADLVWYEKEALEQFRGDSRFTEALTFDPNAPDMLAVASVRGGEILGMAGASADSGTLWQIGINVEEKERGRGTAQRLVLALKNEILRRGILPYYGTSMSHFASQRVALAAGFVPSWTELITEGEEP